MTQRALALALALLVLWTQQLGAQHRASHGLAWTDEPAAIAAALGAPAATTDDPEPRDGHGADTSCGVCVLLAALVLAALPAVLGWRALALHHQAPRVRPAGRQAAPRRRGYQARAPPR